MATAPEGSTAPRGLASAWNVFVKYAPAIVVLIGGGRQLATYLVARHDQQILETRKEVLDLQRPFLDKQFAIYLDAAKATGLLATLPLPTAAGLDAVSGSEDWAWARRRLRQIFYNEISIVTDNTDRNEHQVQVAMGAFEEKLQALEQCIKNGDPPPAPSCSDDQAQMQGASKQLADAIGASIKATWRDYLPAL